MRHELIIVVAAVLDVCGGFLVLANWFEIIRHYHQEGRARSSVPLIGLVWMLIGFSLLPLTRGFRWFPIVFDCGWFLFVLPQVRPLGTCLILQYRRLAP